MLHEYYLHFVDIYSFCGYYSHFDEIIRIGHITRYLAPNVCHDLQSFVLVNAIIYIGHITSYLTFNVRPIFYIYSSSESDWCM